MKKKLILPDIVREEYVSEEALDINDPPDVRYARRVRMQKLLKQLRNNLEQYLKERDGKDS